MQKIVLPPRLPGTLDLQKVNADLHQNTISLDWSLVQELTATEVAPLLAGLDLIKNEDVLNLASIPDQFSDLLLGLLDSQATDATPHLWLGSLDEEILPPDLDKAQSEPQSQASIQIEVTPPDTEPQPDLISTPSFLRRELERLVIQDLHGPSSEEEEIAEASVRDRYLVGILAPKETQDAQDTPELSEELGIADSNTSEDASSNPSITSTTVYKPSSIGMSFSVNLAATELVVRASWGRYTRQQSATQTKPNGSPQNVWLRSPMGGSAKTIQLKPGTIAEWSPEEEEQPEIIVKGLIRKNHHHWTITLFLINGQVEPKTSRDRAWIFQPHLSVEAPQLAPVFQRRHQLQTRSRTEEERTMEMLYRRQTSFAIGHGVSIEAQTLSHDPTRAYRISTSVIPAYEVAKTEAPSSDEIPQLKGLVLDMSELASLTGDQVVHKLNALSLAYTTWIEQQEASIDDPLADLQDHREMALKAIEQCRQTRKRIEEGIQLLATNPQALRAFAFMNTSMWQQRIHTLFAEGVRRGEDRDIASYDIPANRSWRPFQLAFIFLNLPSLTDLQHPDRSTETSAIADLLWFPTGGGKTEAYLGLTAYTIAIRRLQGEVAGRSGEDGVAVIMRYTLRLLTLQQFQRAAALMCACEQIRLSDIDQWGKTPFRLGLWVGQRTTPNTTDQSDEVIKQDHDAKPPRGSIGGVGSPHQLTSCPWCGQAIKPGRNIRVERYPSGRGRTLVFCNDPDGDCLFSQRQSPLEGLPVLVVDEEIYRLLPCLLIATVDKFAQMPWNGATQMLFGKVDKKCSRHGFRCPDLTDTDSHKAIRGLPAASSRPHAPLRPPDLIIQDELHLISGPLGTLVGLYETVVDRLSTWEVGGKAVRPKVIAATATIRRSEQQVRALFMRQVNVFPPNGLEISDNFFSRQRTPGPDAPGRRYLGICATGHRLKAVQIRVYIAFLAAGQHLFDRYGPQADPWMTLVGYFNSLNELGGMRRLVEDDVRSRLLKMDRRGLARRHRLILEELTSRKGSNDIPIVLDRLERTFKKKEPEAEKEKEKEKEKQAPLALPLDVLLATNMISVGVDVKRLGLMVVSGQPKTTAEYIQATSRVGRTYPGLVCIIYNWSRPRDLSHYEKFEHYHATFYQQVEPLSVTPFAPRAIDRGLAALLVSYVRLLGADFNRNEAAGEITSNHPYFLTAINEISRRAAIISSSEEVGESIRKRLEVLIKLWVLKTGNKSSGSSLGYKKQFDNRTINLLEVPGLGEWQDFTCLNSLRDVETPVNLILDERSVGNFEQTEAHV